MASHATKVKPKTTLEQFSWGLSMNCTEIKKNEYKYSKLISTCIQIHLQLIQR